MDDLANLLLGSTLEETICRICVFLAIAEFIGAIFKLIGNLKG